MLEILDLHWICHLDFLQHEMEKMLAYDNSSACSYCFIVGCGVTKGLALQK